ncbi:MAG TPA: DUF547 domain-containing protein [Abditibacteriaceae bacterium]|jgi:hypothetical protein|nr:DUF547 domain-containing protein [Abditibacteriaceae bacterium]
MNLKLYSSHPNTLRPLALAALSLAALVPTASFAQSTSESTTTSGTVITQAKPTAIAQPTTFNQGLLFPTYIFDAALADKVGKAGDIDYATLRGDANLDTFIKAVATADVSRFPVLPVKDEKTGEVTQSRNPEMVFWINAYNAHVLKTISDAFPIDNTQAIKNFDTAKTHMVAGQMWSLADLRKKIVDFDARALFTLTDGSRGGPMMMPQAYRFRTINNDLNDAVARFINDPRNIEITRIQNKVVLSDYFKTANDIFSKKQDAKKMAGLRLLLASYSTNKGGFRGYLSNNPYQITFKPADKALNGKMR